MDGGSELGRALHEEHFWTVVFISGIEARVEGEQASEPIDPRDAADREELQRLLVVLDDLVRHESFEEEHVFPIMFGNTERNLTTLLAHEHRARKPLSERLRVATVNLLEKGVSADRWAAFRAAAQAFAPFILRHIQQEEMAIVRKLDAVVDPETDRQLASQYKAERRAAQSPSAMTGDGRAPALTPRQLAS